MAMAGLRSDTIPEYPPECAPLVDTGFDIIPRLTTVVWPTLSAYATIADVWLVGTYVMFTLFFIPFCTTTPWTAKIRFTLCMAYIFSLRTLTLLCTRYPKVPGIHASYSDVPSIPLAAVLVVLGVRTTQTDYMFSGHTVGWLMTAMCLWHYRREGAQYTVAAIFLWLYNLTGILLLIAVRTHYTSDVLVACFISVLTFTCYHLALKDRHKTYAYKFLTWVDG
jgi:hypothetical protein